MASQYKWTWAPDGISQVRYLSDENDRILGRVTYNLAGAYVAWNGDERLALFLTAEAAMDHFEKQFKLGAAPIPRP